MQRGKNLPAFLLVLLVFSCVSLGQNNSPQNARAQSSNLQRTDAQKPNILFIMGDDIGFMQPRIYHRGLMVGETPNIDRIGNEGGIFMTYYAEQSCTAGRNAFFTGMHPLRTGMIPPQLPGSPSYLRPGTPALAVFLHDLGYTKGGNSARTTSAITPTRCLRRTASRSSGATCITWMQCRA